MARTCVRLWHAADAAAVPSVCQGKRGSVDSQRSNGGDSAGTRSRRSSFALERASFDANRSSLEAFGRSRDASSASLASLELVQVALACFGRHRQPLLASHLPLCRRMPSLGLQQAMDASLKLSCCMS